MLSGAGSVFDLAGTGMPPVKLGSVSSDLRKLAEDFRVVGDDWRKVLGSPEPRRHR